MVHELFKKQDVIEFLLHEAAMVQSDLPDMVRMYRTPLAVMKHFSATGEGGLVEKFRQADKAAAELKFEGAFLPPGGGPPRSGKSR